jgi:IS605 OrfB family transposase
MTITVQLKLLPTPAQVASLRKTLEVCNEAADWVSAQGFAHGVVSQYALQCRYYHDVRTQFGLGAQATCLVFSKVADAYKLDRLTQRRFRPHGSVAFDIRNLKILMAKQQASIWTVDKRERIPFVCGEYQREILARGLIKQSDLVLRRDGRFFLHVSVVLPDKMELKAMDVLGVDLGIVVIAADSDGNKFSGTELNKVRNRNRSLRKKLDRIGTKSAKRLLKNRSVKESRFARDVNHVISKKIVALAKRTGRAIAVEELTGIRGRIKARKRERATQHSWGFAQLGEFISYKAKLAGVKVVEVDPYFTSQRCSVCGHTNKANRKTRDEFCCKACGHTSQADENGAANIRLKGLEMLADAGVLNHPNAEATAYGQIHECSHLQSSPLRVR